MPHPSFRPTVQRLEPRDVPAAGLDDVFNAARYLDDNPDVRAAGMSAEDHFRRFGEREGRGTGGFFDRGVYLDDNPDVRDAVERGITTAVGHFLNNGQFEGRNPNRTFDTAAYLAANPDVAAAVQAGLLTAYQHFIENGQFEDRSPGGGFNLGVYLDDNPDVRDAIERGLLRSGTAHFVGFGIHEGRNKPLKQVITLPPGQQTVTFSGTSANSDDRDFYAIRVPITRDVRVDVVRVSGDFVNVELEDPLTDIDLLELEPKDGVTSDTATLTKDRFYILRVKAVDDVSAEYRVLVTQL